MGTEDPNKMPCPASIFERIAEAFISLDKNWGITYINKKAGELINRDPLSLIGKNIWKEFPEAISVPFYTIVHKAMEDQQDVHVEEYYPPFDTWYKIDFYPSPEESFFFICDINRRKKQEEEIRLEHQRLSAHLNNSPLGLIEWDKDMRITNWSPQAEKIFGWKEAEVLNKNVFGINFIYKDDEELVKNRIEMLMKGITNTSQGINRNNTKTGEMIYCEWHNSVLKNDKGEVCSIMSLVQDITQQKKAEEANEYERKSKEALINNTIDYIWSVDKNLRLIIANETYLNTIERVTGKRIAPGDGILIENGFSQDDIAYWKELYLRALSGEAFKAERHTIIEEQGWDIWAEIAFNPIKEGDEVIGVACYSRDVTDRKKAEKRIQDSEEKRRLIMNAALDAIICIDTKGMITFWNPQAEIIFGWTGNEVNGQKLSEIIIPERYREMHNSGMANYMQTGQGAGLNVLLELSAIDRVGREFPIELTVLPIKQDNEEFFCAFVRDITKRKKNSEALRISNERYNQIAQATNDSIWDWNLLTNEVVREHKKLENLFGYKSWEPAEVDAKWNSLAHPEDWARVTKERNILFTDPTQAYWEDEYRFMRADGEYGYIHDRGYIIRDANGKPIRMIGASQDITSRKKAEQELMEQKQFFEQMFEQSSVSKQIFDKDGWCERINPKFAELFGVKPEHIEGKLYNIFKDEGIKQSGILHHLEKVFHEGKATDWEDQFAIGVAAESQNIEVAEKKQAWYRNWAYPIFGVNGQLIHVIIQHYDITERKNAQQTLQNSELRFRSLIEKGSEIIALHDSEGKILYMSPSIQLLLGHSPEERVGKSAMEFIHPDDMLKSKKTLASLLATPGGIATAQWRHKHADGTWHWMDGVATNLLHDPAVNAVVHNFRDITKQKEAEHKIIQEKELSESIINSLPGIFYLYDETGKFLRWNHNFEKVSGYNTDEISKMSPLDFFDVDEKPLLRDKIDIVFRRGMAEVEAHFLTKTKNKIPYYFNGWSAEFEGTKCLIGMGIDITERKKGEAQLKLLESVITNTTDSVLITEAEPIDGDGPRIVYVNEAFVKMTGYSKKEVIGKTPRILQGPDSDRAELDRLRRALEKWEACEIETINYKKNGEPFWVNFAVAPVANEKGWFTHFISIERDITERKKVEEDIKIKNTELQRLSGYLQNVREEERKHLAREVHDELGQLASALKIDVDWLGLKMADMDENAHKRIAHANKTIEVLIVTIRKIASSMRPSVLDDFGLNTAIQWQCREFENLNGIECIFVSDSNETELPIEINTELFRITQESLTNVMRHSKADKVEVKITEDEEKIFLTIADNGKGFDTTKKKKTLGLIGLRERAVSLNGELNIQSKVGNGTTVTAIIPKKHIS